MNPPPDDPSISLLFSFFTVPDWTVLPSMLVLIILLLCSAMISGSEVAYFSLSPADIKALDEQPEGANERISKLLSRPSKLLATILIFNNLVNIAIILLSSFILDSFLEFGQGQELLQFLMEVVIVTAILLLFGEVIPKIYSASNPLMVARIMSVPLEILNNALSPLSRLLVSSSNALTAKFKHRQSGGEVSSDELEHALELTRDDDTSIEEQRILEGIVKFGNIEVRQIMRPRTETQAFDVKNSFTDLIDGILEAGLSRFPIIRGSFDEVVGTLYVKDLLPYLNRTSFKWQTLMRNPFYIPENKKLDDLLKEFQEKKIHMAIVVDEYGGTSGIVTLEDVIEEIVGDITDEFDEEEVTYSKLDDNNYIFEGKTLLVDLYRVLDIDNEVIEANKGEADTLAGFILELAEKIPQKNERIRFDRFIFTIEASDKRRIKRVKITLNPTGEEEE